MFTRAQRALELAGIAATAGFGALLLGEVAAAGAAGVLPLALLASLPLADGVSGFVHWSADRVLPERLPWIGPVFVRPFRAHHADPLDMTRHGWVATNGNTCVVIAPFLAASWLIVRHTGPEPWALWAISLLVGVALWTALTNQIHKWAHVPAPPRVVRWLQRRRWILSPEHHARHHTPPFDRCYCITTGWLDAWLDRSGCFRALERALRAPAADPRPYPE